MTEIEGKTTIEAPTRLFPLVRYFSYPITLVLRHLSVTPNHITLASLLIGLYGCWLFRLNGYENTLPAAVLFVGCYVLDNCDGEIARMKGLASEFGKRFDTFVDWVVHAAFFLCLGWGVAERTDNNIWFWCGEAAAIGGTINYIIDCIRDFREHAAGVKKINDGPDETGADQAVFVSRVIRTDFCFIVLVLTLLDVLWLLLPASAIGAQVYWGLQFIKGFRRHHV
jgi:archaetidylinositol phosphate synthase